MCACAASEGRGGAESYETCQRRFLQTAPWHCKLATDLDVFLFSIQISKKGRNENEILRGGAGYDLVYDHSKIVGVLEMRAFLLGITLSQK